MAVLAGSGDADGLEKDGDLVAVTSPGTTFPKPPLGQAQSAERADGGDRDQDRAGRVQGGHRA